MVYIPHQRTFLKHMKILDGKPAEWVGKGLDICVNRIVKLQGKILTFE